MSRKIRIGSTAPLFSRAWPTVALLISLALITGCAIDAQFLPGKKITIVQSVPQSTAIVQSPLPVVSPKPLLTGDKLPSLPEAKLESLPREGLAPSPKRPSEASLISYYLPPVLITNDTAYDLAIREPQSHTLSNVEALLSGADLWEKIRQGLKFSRPLLPPVRQEIQWYAKHPRYLEQVGERARLYLAHIVAELERRQMPMDLALLPVIESAFQPFAYSSAGAAGLWQFMPATGKDYGLDKNWWRDNRRDVVEATRAALDYLTKLHQRFKGDWLLAIAAYNTGEGNVSRAIERNRRNNQETSFWVLKLPLETRAYVPRLLAVIELIAEPEKYKIKLPPIPVTPYFATVELEQQIDLALAAEVANISLDEMYMLNPANNRWSTDPAGPHRLNIPLTSVAEFNRRLSQVGSKQQQQWTRHLIQTGDSLTSIARHYHTTIATLQRLNGLSSSFIRSGTSLVVPATVSATSSGEVNFAGLSKTMRRYLRRASEQASMRAIHRVRRGEYLGLIAKRYRVTVNNIVSWNGLDRNAPLMPGQRLIIFDLSPVRVLPQSIASSSGTGLLKYRIVPGDSLSRIAAKYSTTIERLVSLNGITRNTLLLPEKILVVPDPAGLPLSGEIKLYPERVHYIVRAGDSLSRIAKKFNTNLTSLRQWNQLSENTLLHPGQRLLVRKGS